MSESTSQAPRLSRSLSHARQARQLIPGGAHTYAKGDDQFAEGLAPIIRRGQGCRVWDIDGNEYLEFGGGVRSITLGHGYPRVCKAAADALWNGTNFGRPAEIELKAAETFLSCVRGAEMVKFAKNASDATTAAVKLARAATGRNLVAVCGDQPFFSIDDWFIGTTATRAGVPEAVSKLTLTFPYNDVAAVERMFAERGDELACVMLEAERDQTPLPGFLQAVRRLCDKHGTLLLIDETVSGFRLHAGGAQALHGITPDLSTFGKGMANGFSVSALAGKRQFMERGGLTTARERVFLLSTSHGGETHGLAAAIETIREIDERKVCDRLAEAGALLRNMIEDAARAEGVADHFQVSGHPANLVYVTKDAQGHRCQRFRTLFLQESVLRGLLAPNLVVSYSHTDDDLRAAADRIADILPTYRAALEHGTERYLHGRPVKPVFRRFN